MTQLVLHAFDDRERRHRPAFSVSMAGGRAFVHPMRDEWADAAQRVERGLNGGRRLRPVRPPILPADHAGPPVPSPGS